MKYNINLRFPYASSFSVTSTNLDLALTKPQERKQEKMATSEGEDVKAMKASLRTWWKGFAKRKNECECSCYPSEYL